MDVLAQDRSAVIPQIGEADVGPSPPGAENVAALFEIVGIGIFLALLAGAAAILIRQNRRR